MPRNLTLAQLKLGLRDLVERRWDDVLLSAAGRFHGPALRRQLARIESLPAVLTGAAPLASELDAADELHDGFGAAIYFATEVAFRLPDASAELRAAAHRIRQGLIPDLQELHAPYFVEADRAEARRPLLDSLKTDLVQFPVSGQGTLLDVAVKYLDAGALLQELLTQRTDVPRASRHKAMEARADAAALLGRLRADLRLETREEPSLPAQLEVRVFSYFDSMSSMAAAREGQRGEEG